MSFPQIPSSRLPKLAAAAVAVVLTWIQFSAVVSLAELPPKAIAGHIPRSLVAKNESVSRIALASAGYEMSLRR